MKKLYFLLVLLYSGFVNANVPDTIPNASFENWGIVIWDENPTGWMTNNTQLLASTVVKDSDAYSGNLAMRMTNQGAFRPHAWCGFNITTHPLNLGGYVRSLLFNNDSGEIHVRLFYNQQVVDSGFLAFYNGISPLYSAFVIQLSQNSPYADSCEISIEGGTMFQSDVIFDDLQFDLFLNVPVIKKNRLEIFPNPCQKHSTLHIYADNFYPDEIFAINTLGQKQLLNFNIGILSTEDYIYYLPRYKGLMIETDNLSKGIWIITAKNKTEIYTAKLIMY